MKVNRLLFKLFVISTIFSTAIFARGEMGGTLHSGEEKIIKPKNHHALSITRSKSKLSSNASYNVSMINSDAIIYEDKNQVDDIYLVFHDDVLAGDRMKIEVNHGYFDYKITPLQSLPMIVKNVLEPEVLEKAKNQKKKKKKAVPKKKKVLPAIEKKIEEVLPVEVPQEAEVKVPKLESDITHKDPIGKSFFEKFTKIFEDLVKSLAFAPITAKEDIRQEKKEVLVKTVKPSTSKALLPNFDDNALKSAALRSENRFTTAKRGVDTGFNDSALKNSAILEKSAFSAPQRGLMDNFDDHNLQESARVSNKVFNTSKKISVDSQLPSVTEEKFSGIRSREPKFYQQELSTQIEQVPTFTKTAPKVVKREPIVENVTKSVQAVQESMPAKRVATVAELPVNKYIAVPQDIKDKTESYPDIGYKEGYEALEQRRKRVVQKPVRQRVVEDTSLPQIAALRPDAKDERLVITKIIDKEEAAADPFAGRVLGHMDDRVLGNGYNGAATSAKLGMRVTKNSRPVSAWVEVFKNGTKQRVKTFYTSKGRKTKKVKLPSGNYMVRATYRTRDSKQQKTIKNIHLSEGSNINKSIAFYDGKLRVVAHRGDNPLYVKVVAYKSASRQRIGYDFSSRTTGVAELSLVSGTYDIEVIDHKNNRSFDSIRIRGGKTNTLNVDF